MWLILAVLWISACVKAGWFILARWRPVIFAIRMRWFVLASPFGCGY